MISAPLKRAVIDKSGTFSIPSLCQSWDDPNFFMSLCDTSSKIKNETNFTSCVLPCGNESLIKASFFSFLKLFCFAFAWYVQNGRSVIKRWCFWTKGTWKNLAARAVVFRFVFSCYCRPLIGFSFFFFNISVIYDISHHTYGHTFYIWLEMFKAFNHTYTPNSAW